MANHTAQQPGLRSFIVYGELPEGCLAMEVMDNKGRPHVRKGEIVVIDPSQREPINGDMFVVEWLNGDRQVVETRTQNLKVHPRDGSPPEFRDCWFAEWQATITNLAGTEATTHRWGDGPYNEQGMQDKIVGRVVGIYEPNAQLLLRKITQTCNAHNIAVTAFGRRAASDPRFVLDMRNGRVPRPATQAKISAFIVNLGRA
jgi:hypothetical protein